LMARKVATKDGRRDGVRTAGEPVQG